MKFIERILYIEFADFIAAGWKEDTIKKANLRNGQFWQMVPDPSDKRRVLVQYDTLRPKDQEKLTAQFGNVYEYIAKEPIKKLVLADPKAETFFRDYRYDGDKELPPDYQIKYTKAAEWLNMLLKATEQKGFVKEHLGIKHIDKFWMAVKSIIEADGIDLPSSYGNLVSKPDSAIKKYKADGYASLISKHFGNKRSAKVGKSVEGFCPDLEVKQLAVIKKLARLPMNLDATQIASDANLIFQKNGWQTISPATVLNKMSQHMPEIIIDRRGMKEYNNNVAMQVRREAPKFPSYYWTLDGWTVELAYQEGSKFDNRMVMVVVVDACNKYPVGYAIGERENTDLIRMALRNAIIHMQDLFGATYRPWQLQSDRFGIKNLTNFYGAVSHLFTPAAVGNAKSKIIEPYFKYINKTYAQRQFNWTGVNINSRKESQPNFENLNKIKHQLPDKEGVIDQINRFMLKERLSKVVDFKNRWNEMPLEHQVTLTPQQCIEVFGAVHKEFNTITGHGVIATLNGQKMVFDSFDPAFRALQFGTRFKIIYDELDFSQVVAVTEDGKRKFLLQNKMAVGMGIMNTTPEQNDYRKQIKEYNKTRTQEILQSNISEDALVKEILDNTPFALGNDDEAALKLMLTDKYGQQKEGIQNAKGLGRKKEPKQLPVANDERLKFLEQTHDFSQFED